MDSANVLNVMKPSKFNMMLSRHGEYADNHGKRDLRMQEEYKRLYDAYEYLLSVTQQQSAVQPQGLSPESAVEAANDVESLEAAPEKHGDKAKQTQTADVQEDELGLSRLSVAESREKAVAGPSAEKDQFQLELLEAITEREAQWERGKMSEETRARLDTVVANQMQVAKRAADKLLDDAKRAAANIIAEAKTEAETVATTVQASTASTEQAAGANGSKTSAKETALAMGRTAWVARCKEPPALTADELGALWRELRPASSPQPGCKPWQVRFDFRSSDDKGEIETAVARAQGGILGPCCQVALHIVEIKSMAVVDVTGKTRTGNALFVVLSPSERGPLSNVEKLLMNTIHDALLKGAYLRKQATANNEVLTRANNVDACLSALSIRLSMSKELSKVERAMCPLRRLTEPAPLSVRAVTAKWVDEQLAAGMLTKCPNYKDKLARIKAWSQKNLDTFRTHEVIETPKETLHRLVKVVLQRHYAQAEGDAKTAVRGGLIRLHEGNLRDLE